MSRTNQPDAVASADTTPRESGDLWLRLREDILACRLQPGERLKFEGLRATYSASMGTLRETLSQLATEGLVIAQANRGFTVSPVSVADLLDITELRVDLECKALTSSIQEGGDDWEARVVAAYHMLKKLAPAKRDTVVDKDAWTRRHKEFHDALVASCSSPWVLKFRQVLFDQARRYRSLSMKHSSSPGRMEQHQQLFAATIRRDVPAACAIAEAHIRDTARNILQALPGYQRIGPGACN